MGTRHAVDGAIYHGLGHFQQMPHRMDFRSIMGLQVVTTVPYGGLGAVNQMGDIELGVLETEVVVGDETVNGWIGKCLGHGATPIEHRSYH